MFKDFGTFLKNLNIVKIVIGMVISTALADLVRVLIEEFIKPYTDKIVVPNKRVQILGDEVDISTIISKGVGVIVSLILAFILFLILKPSGFSS